jgi:hypothetical protein
LADNRSTGTKTHQVLLAFSIFVLGNAQKDLIAADRRTGERLVTDLVF